MAVKHHQRHFAPPSLCASECNLADLDARQLIREASVSVHRTSPCADFVIRDFVKGLSRFHYPSCAIVLPLFAKSTRVGVFWRFLPFCYLPPAFSASSLCSFLESFNVFLFRRQSCYFWYVFLVMFFVFVMGLVGDLNGL